MATISSLVFKPNLSTQTTHVVISSIQQPHLPNRRNSRKKSCFDYKAANFGRVCVPESLTFNAYCSVIEPKHRNSFDIIDIDDARRVVDDDGVGVGDVIMRLLKSVMKPAMVAVLLSALMMMYTSPHNAIAASGGRMGGRAFSSRSSSSGNSSRSSDSSRSSSSGGSSRSGDLARSSSSGKSSRSSSSGNSSSSGGLARSSSSGKSSRSSSSGNSSSSGGLARSSSSGKSSRSSKSGKSSRSSSSGKSSRSSSSSVWFSPSHSTSYSSSSYHEESPETVCVNSRDENPGYATASIHKPSRVEDQAGPDAVLHYSILTIMGAVALIYAWIQFEQYNAEKTSVLKVQVGLLGFARSLQTDLNRIADVADTSTPEGLSYILSETILALVRHPDFWISGFSSVDVRQGMEKCEELFEQLVIQEREKFDVETLVNVNNIKTKSAGTLTASGSGNVYIVVTVLVAVEGVHQLPAIKSSSDLKEALQKLASFHSRNILAVEVLWTPQLENDTLSERELLEDYPWLRPLM